MRSVPRRWPCGPGALTFLFVLTLSAAARGSALEGPWPKFGADRANSGRGSASGPTAHSGSCQWTYVGQANELRDTTMCSPVTFGVGAAETVYAAYPSELHAVNVTAQDTRWKVSTSQVSGDNTISSQLLVTNTGTLWAGAASGVLRIKDTGGTNNPQVEHFLSSTSSFGYIGGPTLSSDGQLVVFGLESGELAAFPVAASPLKPHWTNENPCNSTVGDEMPPLVTVPVVDEDSDMLFVACGWMCSAIDGKSGDLLWSMELWNDTVTVRGMCMGTSASQGRLFVTSDSGAILSLDVLTQVVMWQSDVSGGGFGPPSVDADGLFIYVASTDGGVYRISALDGDATLLYQSLFPIFGQPLIDTDGVVYASSSDGRVYGMNAETRELVSTLVMPSTDLRTSPTMGRDGSLYIQGFESMFVFVPESCVEFDSHTGKKEWYYWVGVVFFPIAGGVLVLFGTIALIMWIRKRKQSKQIEEDLLINRDDTDSWTTTGYTAM